MLHEPIYADDLAKNAKSETIMRGGMDQISQACDNYDLMHQSFVSTAPSGPGISGAFNFSIFKAPLKALHSGTKIVVKSLLEAPALPGTDNNEKTTNDLNHLK